MDFVAWAFIEMVIIVTITILSVFPHEAGHILAFKLFGVDTYIDWKAIESFGRFRLWCVCVIPHDEDYAPKNKMETVIISFAGAFTGLLFIFGSFLLLSLLHVLTIAGIACLVLLSVSNLLYGLWEVRINLKAFETQFCT